MDSLVTTDWLANELGAPDLRIVDCSWFLPADGRDAHAEFAAAHIPDAVFLDLADLADEHHSAPMMLPSPEKFASRLAQLGLGDGTRIVLYDASPHHTATRGWAMLRAFGLDDVALLNGGFPKWQREGRPTEAGDPAPRPLARAIRTAGRLIADLAAMRANLTSNAAQVIDARSPARFAGEEPEPRPGVVPGHMPGARNLHYATLFADDGTWRDDAALAATFAAAGVDLDRPLVATCGSGVTAAVVAFAAHRLGRDMALYDGSWAEWGADPTTPKETGR